MHRHCTASGKIKLKLDIQFNFTYCSEMSVLEKWGNLDLNQGPAGYESAALTN